MEKSFSCCEGAASHRPRRLRVPLTGTAEMGVAYSWSDLKNAIERIIERRQR
jgi:hypothetical protein